MVNETQGTKVASDSRESKRLAREPTARAFTYLPKVAIYLAAGYYLQFLHFVWKIIVKLSLDVQTI
jgi:hypothetical protein